MSKLTSPLQLDQKILINATQEKVWTIFNDQSLLSKWTCDVQTSNYEHRMASVGGKRVNDCIVNGKNGTITTRCVDMTPYERAEFVVEEDSFGMTKILKGMSFASEFRKIDENQTEFVMQSHYQPKNFFLQMINGIIKWKMGKEVDLMLKGLKDYVETGQVNLNNPINQ